MKNNGPVTGVEKTFPTDEILVSKTDLKGKITYCNTHFVNISGFTEEELLGSSHNLVRHPDMPREAFADLWNELNAGRPWSGLVKNRAKNGDHYWVRANITPIKRDGTIVEFMSVRTCPSRKDITAAEELYTAMRAGRAHLPSQTLRAKLHRWFGPHARHWPLTFMSALVLSFASSMWLGLSSGRSSTELLLLGGMTMFAVSSFLLQNYRQKGATTLLTSMLETISEGQYFNWDDQRPAAEYQPLCDAIRSMQIAQGFESTDSHEIATKSLRIKTALDCVTTNVMIANAQHDIIYANTSLLNMFRDAQSDMEELFPGFTADSLIGTNIDRFHKQPAHQRGMLAHLSGPLEAQVRVGSRYFSFTAVPIVSDTGERQGTVVEWIDRTDQVGIETEVQSIVEQAKQGMLHNRVQLENKDGFYFNLSKSLNELLEVNENVICETVDALKHVSEGNLTQPLSTTYGGSFDELRDHLSTTISHLNDTVTNIRTVMMEVNAGAREIALGNDDLAQRTAQQSEALEHTASSMEQISSTLQHTADHATQAKRLALQAQQKATQGGHIILEAIDAMTEIEEVSHEISKISDVIDEIAFQTNLLALNAAVEAAHAGDEGRGFAVVATEVRALAKRSADSAHTIQELIRRAVEKIQSGTERVKASDTTLQDIIESSVNVNDVINEISNASHEQAQGVQLVNNKLTEIDHATQQNTALVEEIAAASNLLETQANELERLMAFFVTQEIDAFAPHSQTVRCTTDTPERDYA